MAARLVIFLMNVSNEHRMWQFISLNVILKGIYASHNGYRFMIWLILSRVGYFLSSSFPHVINQLVYICRLINCNAWKKWNLFMLLSSLRFQCFAMKYWFISNIFSILEFVLITLCLSLTIWCIQCNLLEIFILYNIKIRSNFHEHCKIMSVLINGKQFMTQLWFSSSSDWGGR